ncbi:MAG: hypothetical protein DWQ37_14365 [Planctomycetota bacterium]|nr:MAG: hypothetical protein DWQ37_14365 [Planctomycetota bacterium]
MKLRYPVLLVIPSLVVALGATAAWGQAAFQAPPQSLALDETGTLEAMQGNLLKFKDSKDDIWLVKVHPMAKVSIEGEAGVDYLRSGQTVDLTGEIKSDGTFAEPIEEMTLVSLRGRSTTGLFEPDADPDEEKVKPVREPAPGKYRVRGRILKVNDGEILMLAGRLKLTAKAAEDMKVKLTVNDPRAAQVGDEMELKAWYYERYRPIAMRPGQALAESVKITLSKPPEPGR